ncbi:MAG: 4Fe-4S dicluster domain-containing protein [Planctomycetes bacterium]|nr:4Fe-4S dicluster domain-containing protein [Planctomycetota bacterium]
MPSVNPNKTGRAYWRSLDDLQDTPQFRELLSKEFADYTPEQILESPSRRSFMKIMGASMALAGAGSMSGCRRWPEQKVAPYNMRPEGRIPGIPVHYATAMELGGVAQPLLVTSFDGRPTKIEGNPSHPQSNGAAGVYAQASVLEMYDPERSRRVLNAGKDSTYDAFFKAVGKFADGEGLSVLCEATSSPSIAALRAKMPKVQWYEYEALTRDNEREGAKLAFGQAVRAQLHLDKAKVIACFDADILGEHPASLAHARAWAAGRKGLDATMSRMYAVENTFTITGTCADERLAVASGRVLDVLKAVASELGIQVSSATPLDGDAAAFVKRLAAELKANEGKGLVAAGPTQPAATHALAALVNEKLGNLGSTVSYLAEPDETRPSHVEALSTLTKLMNDGSVPTLLIIGGNPVYDAPVDLNFAAALAKVKTSIHLSTYVNETSKGCAWHLPRSHYLEAWGDTRAWDGTISVVQPLILPLYGTLSAIELLAKLSGEEITDGLAIVRRTFSQWIGSDVFERQWRKTLSDGLLANSAAETVKVSVSDKALAIVSATVADTGLELTFRQDYAVYDGRFANNGWLQELPDPMTKVVWDNVAIVGWKTAESLGLAQGDLVELKVGDRTMNAPVFIVPGQADESITMSLGYGRTAAGYVGNEVGFDVYQARTASRMYAMRVDLKKLGRKYQIATTQDYYAIDPTARREREHRVSGELYREASVEEYENYKHNMHSGKHHVIEFRIDEAPHVPSQEERGRTMPLQIIDEPVDYYEGQPRWAMSIDLSSCIGCNACVMACQSENNIAVVGKQEAARGRAMHWIRVDRYFKGDPDNANKMHAVHQPVTCHQCENAPCEQVCPVAATTHDSEGLNVMIYNRCIGTRYCSNNCPYKVRRFNWFDWHAKPVHSNITGGTWLGIPDQQQLSIDKVRQMQFNPEVTVRMRGVMEKCTFCVQRIKAVTIPAKNEGRNVEDGQIVTACQQTCPTQAITFGDLSDPNSKVSQQFKNDRAYEMLRDLNVRARTRYLARINNPATSVGSGEPAGEHHA